MAPKPFGLFDGKRIEARAPPVAFRSSPTSQFGKATAGSLVLPRVLVDIVLEPHHPSQLPRTGICVRRVRVAWRHGQDIREHLNRLIGRLRVETSSNRHSRCLPQRVAQGL